MATAVRNLILVTLELGGNSPCVMASDFPIPTATVARPRNSVLGNTLNFSISLDYQ